MRTTRKNKIAEPESSPKITNSKQQQTVEEVTNTCDGSVGDVRSKIGISAKRTKKPPKSLENFICRPTIRISQRIAHRGNSETKVGKKSHRDVEKKDSDEMASPKGSKHLPAATLPDEADSTPTSTSSAKKPSRNTRRTESKPSSTSEYLSYSIQPQTDSKVPLSDRKEGPTSLKKTCSPPAAPSPSPSTQQNSSPLESIQFFNAQKTNGKNLHDGEPKTPSLNSESSLEKTLNSEDSQKKSPSPTKKTTRARESNVDKGLKTNQNEDGNSTSSQSILNIISEGSSNGNGLLPQPSTSIKTPLFHPAPEKYTESATAKRSSCMPDLLESRGRHNESEVIEDAMKTTVEHTEMFAVQPKDYNKVGHVVENNKKTSRCSLSQEEKLQCSLQTPTCEDSQLNSLLPLNEIQTHLIEPQILPDRQNPVQTTDQVGSKNLLKKENVSQITPAKSKCKSKALQQQVKLIPFRQPHKSKQLQNPSCRSDATSLEPITKKRGRPKITRMEESPLESSLQKSYTKLPIPKTPDTPGPEQGLRFSKSKPEMQIDHYHSSSVQTEKAKLLDSASGKTRAVEKVSKIRAAQIHHKRNRRIMKTIITNINKMGVKRKDKVITQILSGNCTTDLAQKHKEGNADCSVSGSTNALSSLVTSFGGKLGPQINFSKRGTIYIGKRRGRKPKTKREPFACHSVQAFPPMSQQISTESTNELISSTPSGEGTQSSDARSILRLKPTSRNVSSFRRKLQSGHHELDQPSVPKKFNTPKVKTMPEKKFKQRSSLLTITCPSTKSQLDSVDHGTKHPAKSILVEQDSLIKYKCPRKGHHCSSHDKIGKHKHKCKKKYLQLKAKRQDSTLLAEIEELVVRLREIHIVHHIPRGYADEVKSGRNSAKARSHPHVLQCLPQNLHHPTLFQINFSGYYSPQSDYSRDPHYVGMSDFKRNNGCPTQPGGHIVTHCPVVHKLGYPLSGDRYYHPPYKVTVPTPSFGFGLYRGYHPSATIYPSSPFLPSYVHSYSKNSILSPSKFHKKKHKVLRCESKLCHGKPQGNFTNVTAHSSSDWFSKTTWQREDNREPGSGKRSVHDHFGGRETTEGLIRHRKSRQDLLRRAMATNYPSSSATNPKKPEKHKTSPLSYIGPAHLRPKSTSKWAEHQPPWRWRESVLTEPRKRGFNLEAVTGFQEDDNIGDEEPSPPVLKRRIPHHSILKNPTCTTSAFRQMTGQRSFGEVHCASTNFLTAGSSLMGSFSTSDKRLSGSFQTGGSLFAESYSSPLSSFSEGQKRGGREKKQTHFQTASFGISPTFSTNKNSFFHSSFGEDTTLDKDKLKHDKTAYVKRTARDQMFTGTEVKKRGRGRPRKNPLPCFSPPPPASPFDHTMTDRPAKRKKGEGQDYTGLHSFKMMVQQEKRQRRCKRNEDIFSPFQDSPESANIHLEDHSAPTSGKKYEWAGLYSDIYKSEIPKSLSSPAHTDSLEYDPEKHEYGLLPAPIHVGKYLRLKRIDFQLPYEIYQLSAQKKCSKKSRTPRIKLSSNGPDQEKSQTEVTSSKAHDCVSGTASRIDVNQQTAASLETVEEITESDVCNTVLSQSAPPKQQETGSNAENTPSPLLMMPLSCEERSFVLEHCVFLVRNYEKMRDRQALLLGDEAMERETENGEDEGSGHKQPGDVEGASTKSDQNQSHLNSQSERREGCEGGRSVPCKNLLQTLQGIYDVIVSHKGASGQTLAAPLLNLRSRKRSGSAPVDLTMLQMQLLSGLYQSLDSFHSDMLKVFHCAEKYYGCDSSVGRNVRQLRDIYYDAHQEALTQLSSFL